MRYLSTCFAVVGCLALTSAAHAILDSNADSISDVWQARYAAGAVAASLDSDGDGFSNFQESILGTDPFDPTSRLNQGFVLLPDGSVRLDWPAIRGKRYKVESSTDLVNWTLVKTLDGIEGAHVETVTPTVAGANLFTRVRIEDVDTDLDGVSDWEERLVGFNVNRVFSEGLGNNPTTPTTGNPRTTDFERLKSLLAAIAQTVTIAAVDPAMAENWPDPGVVVIRRVGKITPLTVTFKLSGTATSGFDYATPAFASVTIPFGADEAYLSLTPLADALTEGDETIIVTIEAGVGYTLGTATTATLTISDSADGRPAEKAASRFLTQATFGPQADEVARVRQLGFAAWIDAQFARPLNLHLPIVQVWQTELGATTYAPVVNVEHRMEAWWRQTMRSDIDSDPLRQRVAFALSQIFVVSDRMTSLSDDERGMTSYQDMLLTQSFGTYRQLIEAVTRHPWMGLYLSSLRNRKPNVSLNRFPDENYAREVMQLLSIGLWRLNQDGTRVVSSGTDLGPDGIAIPAGQWIPTYGDPQIGVFARAFTGLSFGTRFTNATNITEIPTKTFYDSYNVPWRPMRMWDVEHDVAAKTLWLPGTTALQLPARTASSPDTGTAGDADLAATLDYLAAHPNVAPFISRQLIQRLVTSNPTPAYIARISAVFADNGSGVRGDLKAVIRAILLDTEARDYARTQVASHGLVREPYTRYVSLGRSLGIVPSLDGRFRGFSGLDSEIVQRPLSAPSVFNFYSPDYRPPGVMTAASLVSPELQIINSVSAITSPNRFSAALASTSTTANVTQFNVTTQSDNAVTTTVDESLWNVRFDETPWLALALGDPDALVSALDRALCAGSMAPQTFRTITRALRRLNDPAQSGITTTERDIRARARFRVAAHLVVISADAAVLK